MELGQENGLRKTSDSFKNTTEEEGFAVGVTEERKEAKFCEGGKRDRGHINYYGTRCIDLERGE